MRRKSILFLTMIGSMIAALFLYYFYLSNARRMSLQQYYHVQSGEMAIVLQAERSNEKAVLLNDRVYVPLELVQEQINERFYLDVHEKQILFTTPTQLIQTSIGSKEYESNQTLESSGYPLSEQKSGTVYVCLDFVKKLTGISFQVYEKPSRVVIDLTPEKKTVATLKKNAKLRYQPSWKGVIVADLKKQQSIQIVAQKNNEETGFCRVMTQDGVIGYVKKRCLGKKMIKLEKERTKQPVYTNIRKDRPIHLVWHQVTNQMANTYLESLLSKTKGINTISPTWFSVVGEDGTISSLASSNYVQKAHEMGLEVWGLVDDFQKRVSMYRVLSSTTVRQQLIKNLMNQVETYGLDGLNVDFENISKETAQHYIQFIRELSIVCREKQIVLSIDNYVPMAYSAYYNRKEQGIVADYVIAMAYDEYHSASTESGSVSSYSFVKSGIENTLKEVPKEKLIVALPFYTRLWKEEQQDGRQKITSKAYGMEDAERIVKENQATVLWDEQKRQYYVTFQKENTVYKMWLEEERSLEQKLQLVKESGAAGVAWWKLGLQKQEIWDMIENCMGE